MRRPPRHRTVVAALAATTTTGYGVLFYAYGVLLVPMERDLGWSRPTLTAAFSGALVIAALCTLAVGRFLDRHAPRTLFLAGAAAATALAAGWSASQQRVMFFAVWAGLGACMAILFYEPAFTVITKWFRGRERHRAITTVTLVAGLASTIFAPLTAVLEGAFGWRRAVLVLAAILGAVTLPTFAWLLHQPRAHADEPHPHAHTGTLPRHAFASAQFWLITLAYLLSAITTFAVAVHLVPYLRAHGWTSGAAASVLGSVGFVQVAGRSMFARLSIRIASGPLGTLVLLAKAAGLAVLIAEPRLGGVIAFVAVYGAANGLQTLTRATVVADLYGALHYGSISAVVGAVSTVGGAIAPFAFAAAVSVVGRDAPVLWGLVGVSVLAAAANARATAPRFAARVDGADDV